MLASWIAKRMIRSAFDTLSQDDFDVESLVARKTEDAAYGYPSDFGVGEVVKGKQASVEWLNRWKKEVPKRKFVVKNICMKGSCLPSPNNVVMVEWGCVETNKEGKEFQYDGVTVMDIKNMKCVRSSEYVSFKGLPKLSTLIKPTGKAKV